MKKKILVRSVQTDYNRKIKNKYETEEKRTRGVRSPIIPT